MFKKLSFAIAAAIISAFAASGQNHIPPKEPERIVAEGCLTADLEIRLPENDTTIVVVLEIYNECESTIPFLVDLYANYSGCEPLIPYYAAAKTPHETHYFDIRNHSNFTDSQEPTLLSIKPGESIIIEVDISQLFDFEQYDDEEYDELEIIFIQQFPLVDEQGKAVFTSPDTTHRSRVRHYVECCTTVSRRDIERQLKKRHDSN